MKSPFLLLFLLIFLTVGTFANESFFLMPRDAKQALKSLSHDLKNAKKNIRIAIYSFTHKELADSIKSAARRGVKVTIIFDEESNVRKTYSRLGGLAKLKNVTAYTLKGEANPKKGYAGKMHMKMAVIDDSTIYFGSANWSYSAFSISYELLYRTDSTRIITQSLDYFKELTARATPY